MRVQLMWMLVLLTALIGCRSSHPLPPPGGEVQPPDHGQVVKYNEERMPGAPQPSAAVVSGRITVSGFTVLSEGGTPVAGGESSTKVLAQLIDPEDDILSETRPGADGTYQLTYTGQKTKVKLRLRFKVQEDVDGDGKGADQIEQAIPLTLALGLASSVDIALRKAAEADVEQSLRPAKGLVLLADVHRLDGTGKHVDFYGTFFADGFVVITLDGDRFLEPGDDLRAVDHNRNGWPDLDEARYDDPSLTSATISGVIVSVDSAHQTLMLKDKAGKQTLVIFAPFAAIEPMNAAGDFYGAVPLTPLLAGSAVTVQGWPLPEGFLADWIVVSAAG
jgi:hypothetical protein